MKMKLWLLGSLLVIHGAYAQNYEWAKSMGESSTDQGTGIAVDPSGNVYTVGQFYNSVDFDPGAGTTTLTAVGNEDFFIQKLDANGDFLWARSVGGGASEYANTVVLDASGNIYISGSFSGTVDFDPGAGVSNLTAQVSYDAFVLKLNANGNFLWVRGFEGITGYSEATSIKLDAAGNVYTCGYFENSVDFDPSANAYSIISQGGTDVFVQKMDVNGNFLWAKTFGGTGADEGRIFVDPAGNIFTTGYYTGTVDFDPGVSNSDLTATAFQDAFIQKMDANGNFAWVKGLDGTAWDSGSSIVTDAAGNVYMVGSFDGTTDFDPGVGVVSGSTTGNYDIFVLKLDMNGDYLWVKSVGGSGDDQAASVGMDALGNIYVTGIFSSTVDFNSGVGVANLTSVGAIDCFILKLNADGNYIWAVSAGGTSYDYSRSIALSTSGSVYTTGTFQNTADFDPGAGTANFTSQGGYDAFVLKLSQCTANTGTDVQTACGPYTWINGTTYTASNSTATYTLTNQGGCDSLVTLNLTINSVDASVTDNSPTFSANAAGAIYQWIDCNNGNAAISGATNQSFTATANGNYAVVVTQNGCSDTSACFLLDNIGLNELQNDEVVVYPNPSEGLFFIDFAGELNEVRVLDLSGRPVHVEVDLNAGQVDGSTLVPGKYILQVVTSEQKTLLKSISIQ